jgi:hypothetical protein
MWVGLLFAVLLASAERGGTAWYQAYTIYYAGENCNISEFYLVELYRAASARSREGTLNDRCIDGMQCVSEQGASHERVCVSGQPVGSLRMSSVRGPLVHHPLGALRTLHASQQLLALSAWRAGVHRHGDSFYAVDPSRCALSRCASSKCTAQPLHAQRVLNYSAFAVYLTGDILNGTAWIECAHDTISDGHKDTHRNTHRDTHSDRHSEIESLFYVNESEYVWDSECAAGCRRSWLGDGLCDRPCNNAACNHDCTSTRCDCCTPHGDHCCIPTRYAHANANANANANTRQCCAENGADEANARYIAAFEECLCDGRGPLNAFGLCTVPLQRTCADIEREARCRAQAITCYPKHSDPSKHSEHSKHSKHSKHSSERVPDYINAGAVIECDRSVMFQCRRNAFAAECKLQCDAEYPLCPRAQRALLTAQWTLTLALLLCCAMLLRAKCAKQFRFRNSWRS